MKSDWWDVLLVLRDWAKAIPIISDNRFPLLTECNFQASSPSILFGYLWEPPPSRPNPFIKTPYYLELESNGLREVSKKQLLVSITKYVKKFIYDGKKR